MKVDLLECDGSFAMTRMMTRCFCVAVVGLPLALAGCGMMGGSDASPTNGGATQTTGLGSNGPASDSGGAGDHGGTSGAGAK
jgi:hypothetical protein